MPDADDAGPYSKRIHTQGDAMSQGYTTKPDLATQIVPDEWDIPSNPPKPPPADWTAFSVLGYAAKTECTPEQFDHFLIAAGLQFRYNIRSQRQQWRRVPFLDEMGAKGWNTLTGWQDWTDTISTNIRAELASQEAAVPYRAPGAPDLKVVMKSLEMAERPFEAAVKLVCARNAVDPFVEYLENETPIWDRVPRLSGWILYCFDVADESLDLAAWAGQFMFLGAVQRAMQPGCKLDETPVLIGPPGIGKSTALRLTFPPELQDLFTDGLNLASDAKTRVEAMQGRAIVEIGEMAGARRVDVESLKAFLSRTDDGSVRLTWRHNPEPMPRRCIVVGTADRSDPLPPDHNLRRFVPVTLTAGDVAGLIDFMEANRGQLWAEALTLYQRGQDARLPDWLKEQQREATDNARFTDAILDGVEQYLSNAPDTFTLEDIGYALNLIEGPHDGATLSPLDQQRLGAALRQCGYQKKRRRIHGLLKNVYSAGK